MRLKHTITIGETESGKTVLNKRLAAYYRENGIKNCVLDPMMDPEWPADFMTRDPVEFLAFVKNPDKCLRCALFVDETGMSLDKYAVEYQWLSTTSRHHGHACHFISQRAQQINATIRSQCSILYMFRVNYKDAKVYSEDFNFPDSIARQAPDLKQGEYFRIARFEPVSRFRLWA